MECGCQEFFNEVLLRGNKKSKVEIFLIRTLGVFRTKVARCKMQVTRCHLSTPEYDIKCGLLHWGCMLPLAELTSACYRLLLVSWMQEGIHLEQQQAGVVFTCHFKSFTLFTCWIPTFTSKFWRIFRILLNFVWHKVVKYKFCAVEKFFFQQMRLHL